MWDTGTGQGGRHDNLRDECEAVYQALAPWAEALLRVSVGLALVPHGLRNTFGLFPKTGTRSHSLTELAQQLQAAMTSRFHSRSWGPAISLVCQLVLRC